MVRLDYITNIELLGCNYISESLLQANVDTFLYTSWLDKTISYCIPSRLCSDITTQLVNQAGFHDNMLYDESASLEKIQYYHMTALPISCWTVDYNTDISTDTIMLSLSHSNKPGNLEGVNVEYRSHLKSHLIVILYHKLVLYKPICQKSKYIGLVIVPVRSRHTILSHYHVGPSGGHMEEHKILFLNRIQFF